MRGLKPIFVLLVLFIALAGANTGAVFAQDPDQPDSLIIELVDLISWVPSVMVPVYAVTDDPVGQITIPLEWDSPDGMIHPAGIFYFPPLLLWDEISDTIDLDNRHILITGAHDTGGSPNPVLNTNYQRQHVFSIRIVIDQDALGQLAPIGAYDDPIHGPPTFVLDDGVTSFTPVVQTGGVVYGAVGIDDDRRSLPTSFALSQNYPNPFNMQTEISFTVPSRSYVTLEIFDLLGRKVSTLISGNFDAGYYTAAWNGIDSQGNSVSSGLYFYTLKAGDIKLSRKMLLLK